MHIII